MTEGAKLPLFFRKNSAIRILMLQKEKIIHLAEQAGKMHNVLIYDMEFKGDRLIIYIDKKQGQVDVQDCEKINSALQFLFLSENIPDMDVEISSPGLERKLTQNWHFQSALGKKIKLQTYQPVLYDERQKTSLEGNLHNCSEQDIVVNDGGRDWKVSLNNIKTARIVFES